MAVTDETKNKWWKRLEMGVVFVVLCLKRKKKKKEKVRALPGIEPGPPVP